MNTLPDLELVPNQDPTIIDLGLGDTFFIRKALMEVMSEYKVPLPVNSVSSIQEYNYPNPKGYDKLLNLLKEKHQTDNVVVTNGAKQGLSAVFWALKQKGTTSVYSPSPYWLSFPTLIAKEGLEFSIAPDSNKQAILLVTPNNPDGRLYSQKELISLENESIDNNKPLVFDAAYFTKQYVPEDYQLKPVGDVQIYSYAKQYGLSGLRVGYCVTKTKDLAKQIEDYVEITTSGVSIPAQNLMYFIEDFFKNNPKAEESFYRRCRIHLEYNRSLLKNISKEILNTSSLPESGMFAFLEKEVKFDETYPFSKTKLLDGHLFGKPGFARISLGTYSFVLEEAINRLNDTLNKE